jgi:hypothetical protein
VHITLDSVSFHTHTHTHTHAHTHAQTHTAGRALSLLRDICLVSAQRHMHVCTYTTDCISHWTMFHFYTLHLTHTSSYTHFILHTLNLTRTSSYTLDSVSFLHSSMDSDSFYAPQAVPLSVLLRAVAPARSVRFKAL